MTKKQTVFIMILCIAIAAVALYVIYLFYFKDTVKAKSLSGDSNVSNSTQSLYPTNSDTISLQPKQTAPEDPNALAVNDSASSSANLGSGSRWAGETSSASSSSSSSGKEDFSQYEQYKDKTEVYFGDLKNGDGDIAQKDLQLAVTYTGYLTNGQVFDRSKVGNNGQLQPLMFKLGAGQLIPGFEQGVAGMKAGGARRVIIPPSLGYGDKEQNGIPANSVLIFDIQLTAVQ